MEKWFLKFILHICRIVKFSFRNAYKIGGHLNNTLQCQVDISRTPPRDILLSKIRNSFQAYKASNYEIK